MTIEPSADIRADIEKRILGLESEVWWSRQDRAYIAYSIEFPACISSDGWSSLAAVNKLEDRVRQSLIAESTRTAA